LSFVSVVPNNPTDNEVLRNNLYYAELKDNVFLVHMPHLKMEKYPHPPPVHIEYFAAANPYTQTIASMRPLRLEMPW
jgi:hypothetical protein